jgi:hypothetical protein
VATALAQSLLPISAAVSRELLPYSPGVLDVLNGPDSCGTADARDRMHPFRDGDRSYFGLRAGSPRSASGGMRVYAFAGDFWDRDAHRADVDLDR